MARRAVNNDQQCDPYRNLNIVELPKVVVGKSLLQQPWNASLESRLRVYRDELRKRGYSLLDRVLAMTPGCAGLVADWSLHFSMHHLARLPARPCDESDVNVAGIRCKEKAAYTVKIVDRVKNGMSLWLKARQEVLLHSLASQHNNVLVLLEVIYSANAIYMVQGLAIKGTISDNIPPHGMCERKCLFIMQGVIHGVHFLHKLNIVHRNLTCDNIWLDIDDTPKIAEFGVACKLPTRHHELFQPVGTDEYKAPELLLLHPYNGFKVDIWNIGTVMYIMLFNSMPFKGRRNLKTLECRRLNFSERDISAEAEEVIRSSLRFHPRLRPTAHQLLQLDWLTAHQPEYLAKPDGNEQEEPASTKKTSVYLGLDRSLPEWATLHTAYGSIQSILLHSRHYNDSKARLKVLDYRARVAKLRRPAHVFEINSSKARRHSSIKFPCIRKPQKVCSFCQEPARQWKQDDEVHKSDTKPKAYEPFQDNIVQHRDPTPWMTIGANHTYNRDSTRSVYCSSKQCRRELISEQVMNQTDTTGWILQFNSYKPSTTLKEILEENCQGYPLKTHHHHSASGRDNKHLPDSVTVWTADLTTYQGDINSLRFHTGSQSLIPKQSSELLSTLTPSGHRRNIDIDERQEARLWESLSLKSIGSGHVISLEQVRDMAQLHTTSNIMESSLHSITEIDETTVQ